MFEQIRPKRKGKPGNRKHPWTKQHVYDAACNHFNSMSSSTLESLVKEMKTAVEPPFEHRVMDLPLTVGMSRVIWIAEEILKERRKRSREVKIL